MGFLTSFGMTGSIRINMKEKEQVRCGEPAPFPSLNQIELSFRLERSEMRNLRNALLELSKICHFNSEALHSYQDGGFSQIPIF